jgi:hypothetical protein
MAMKFINLAQVLADLETSRKAVVATAREAIKAGAQVIEQQAIRNAPIDQGELEQSIELAVKRAVSPGVYEVEVFVSARAAEYAWIVHEYSWQRRGPKTKAKGPAAGPRYMARAFEKHYRGVRQMVEDRVRETIARQNRRRR